jgi:hypothetical protein
VIAAFVALLVVGWMRMRRKGFIKPSVSPPSEASAKASDAPVVLPPPSHVERVPAAVQAPSPDRPRFCMDCGGGLEPSDQFCSSCGERVTWVPQ